ncbi:MAG: alpha/beta fold hydrolase [Planctomycetota bacterium]
MLAVALAVVVAEKPQDSVPPFPYEVREVEIASVDDVTLAGTLTVPEGEGPWPAAVLLTGSGPQDRDEALFGHRPFAVLADALTRRGIAVLRYDDRGFAASTGDFAASTINDFAADAHAAASFADALPELDAVGFIGHSEGGITGPMATIRDDSPIDFVITLAGPGLNGIDILARQSADLIAAMGVPAERAERIGELNRTALTAAANGADAETLRPMIAALVTAQFGITGEPNEAQQAQIDQTVNAVLPQLQAPWFKVFLNTDPADSLGQLDVPVLAIFAGQDLQVSAEQNAPVVEAILDDAPTDDVTVVTLPGLSHFLHDVGKTPAAVFAYDRSEQTMSPVVWETIAPWINERFGADAGE